jgi:2-C-methyl-D-erythritol 4-phosphate cytidylyltransferase
MNYGLILAGGVGQRMRNTGMPKQFLKVFGKPIIIYTLEKFENCIDIDKIIISCHSSWKEHLEKLIKQYELKKIKVIINGGKDRQESILNGLSYLKSNGANDNDIIVIHDGVRPLITENVISENVETALKYDCAITVHPVIETVVITQNEEANFEDFKKRDDTYSLTSPQTFKLSLLNKIYDKYNTLNSPIPLLDSALIYTYLGNKIHLIKDNNKNIKITTPDDYYTLKSLLELDENKNVFGLN